MIELKNILLPTDFSEPSLEAARYGVELGRRFGATLHLLHVIEDPVVYFPPFENQAIPTKDEREAVARTALEGWELPEGADQCPIERRWRHGTPFVQIVSRETYAAREDESDEDRETRDLIEQAFAEGAACVFNVWPLDAADGEDEG